MKYNSSEIWALVRNIKKDLKENSIDGTISDGLFSAIDNVNIYDYSKNYITDGNCTPIEIIYDSLLQNYTDYLITSAYPFFSSDIFIVDSEEEQLNLIIKKGDICIRNDISTSFFALGTKNYSINEDWVEILTSGSGGGINIHNDLNGIEGTGPNYYHLNSEEYLNLHDPVTVNLPLVLSGQDISLNYDKNIFNIINDELTIITSALELDNYYTKTQLQTSGQSSIHWGNITNAPAFITSVNWDDIGSKPTEFTPEAHNHDTRYYTRTNLQTSGQSSVHWGNVTNAPSFITDVNWDDIGSKPTVFPPESHGSSHFMTGTDPISNNAFGLYSINNTDPYYVGLDYGGIGIGSDGGNNRQIVAITNGAGSQKIFSVLSSADAGATWLNNFNIAHNGIVHSVGPVLIGSGDGNPQNLLHIDGSSSPGLQISNGFSDGNDGLSINLEGSLAVYKVSYTGSHVFGIETTPGVWETGLVVGDTPVNGPTVTTPQIVVGEPTGSDMGIGSLNAEALYVNGEPVITGTFDIGDYVTIATDQNITGQKTFSQGIGIGTDNPQRLLHLNTDDNSRIGIGLGRYGNVDNYLSIDLYGNNASYNIGYSGSHVFEVETAPGESEIGLWISGQYHTGPTVQAYQLVAGNPYGWGMGEGSINAEALYVEGVPVVTGTFDSSDYYTKANLQTSGQSSVHAGNITNVPWLTSLPSHDHDIRYYTYTQLQTSGESQVHAGNITNAPWLTSLPSHDHDTRYDARYYTRTNLHTSGQASVHWGNVTNKPTEFPSEDHVHDTDDLNSGVLPVERGGTGFSNGYGFVVAHGINNPMDTIELIPWNHIDGKPTVFPPEDHNHDDRYLTGNPFDQDLNTTDKVKFDGVINQNAGVDSYHYRSVASKEITGSSTTGTMKITMPQSWSNTVLTIKIAGYTYDSATGWWECIVSGYNYYPVPKWYDPECELRGNPPFSDVRLAYDGTKCCLLLGNTSTTWNYTDIHITDVITGLGNYTAWGTGWSINLITNESGISDIATPDVDRPWHSGNLDIDDYYTKTNLQTSGQASVHASNINSGTLSDSRLSFNPDYFVQGTDSYRRVDYNSTNTLDDNNASGFFRLDLTDPANPDGTTYYGLRTRHNYSYSVELAGRADNNKLWFGGLGSGIRQPWREIHHSGVNYIKYDNNPAEVSHPTTSEDLGTSNQTLNPTKGIYYAQGRSDTQTITMGNPQFFGQTVEIVHNGQQPLRVFCGPFNPPMTVNVPEYSILRLRAISTPAYIGWSPFI